MTNALQTLVEQLEQDRSLDAPNRLRERIEALDRIETCLIHRGPTVDMIDLDQRIVSIHSRFEALNHAQYTTIRHEIRRGAGADALREWLGQHAHDVNSAHGEGYDYLDALISGVLQFDEPGADIAELPADMVFYQPTPARHIQDFLGRAALSERDVLIDLGSGLGHVPLLTAICTRARSVGIELEAAYVECAKRAAQALNLRNVAFIQKDARQVDLSEGTLFYLYTPFSGAVLRSVLDSLRYAATQRNIRIATLGPCTPIVAEEPWLESIGVPQRDRIAIFHSVI